MFHVSLENLASENVDVSEGISNVFTVCCETFNASRDSWKFVEWKTGNVCQTVERFLLKRNIEKSLKRVNKTGFEYHRKYHAKIISCSVEREARPKNFLHIQHVTSGGISACKPAS